MTVQSHKAHEAEQDDDVDFTTSLVNREIYTVSGLYVGTVTDVKLNFNTLSISHLTVDAEEVNPDVYAVQTGKDGILIPYRWTRAVGDIIIINDIGPKSEA